MTGPPGHCSWCKVHARRSSAVRPLQPHGRRMYSRQVMEEAMSERFEAAYTAVRDWAKSHGIQVSLKRLPAKKAGEFDGLSISMNSDYEWEETTYYLVHALGSIVRWSLSGPA